MTTERPHTYKVVELVGSSAKGVDDAIQNAVDRAGETLRNLDWFEVKEVRGHIEGGRIGHYQVRIGIGFRVLDPSDLQDD